VQDEMYEVQPALVICNRKEVQGESECWQLKVEHVSEQVLDRNGATGAVYRAEIGLLWIPRREKIRTIYSSLHQVNDHLPKCCGVMSRAHERH
jgi:hypothetical protein